MRQSFVHAKSVIEASGYSLEQIREYLDDLRDTGRIGPLHGAGDYLINVWGFTRHEVEPILLEYLNCGLREELDPVELSYGLRDKKGGQDDDDI